jgi:hypothetical protein
MKKFNFKQKKVWCETDIILYFRTCWFHARLFFGPQIFLSIRTMQQELQIQSNSKFNKLRIKIEREIQRKYRIEVVFRVRAKV